MEDAQIGTFVFIFLLFPRVSFGRFSGNVGLGLGREFVPFGWDGDICWPCPRDSIVWQGWSYYCIFGQCQEIGMNVCGSNGSNSS